MKAFLDVGLIWFYENVDKNLSYLDQVTTFINYYLDVDYCVTKTFLVLLSRLMQDPMGEYRESEEYKNSIMRSFWSNINLDEIHEDAQIKEAVMPPNFIMPRRDDLRDYMNESFSIMSSEDDDYIFFLSPLNFEYGIILNQKTHTVKHIYKEVGSYLAELFSRQEYIKTEALKKPTLENPLPNVELCREYSILRKEKIEHGQGGIATFLELGKEVAMRNGYKYDENISRINTAGIRKIYSSSSIPKLYLSIDVEHGAFELCNDRGQHQGEYSYEGVATDPVKRADHNIKIRR